MAHPIRRAEELGVFALASMVLACSSDASIDGAQGSGQEWRVAAVPALIVGAQDGSPEYLLSGVQFARVQSDHVTVVGQWYRGYFELRYYDQQGVYITSAGRAGEGPWEVSNVAYIQRLASDSLLVMEVSGKFSVFGPRGEPVREGRHSLPSVLHRLAQPIDEHRVLMRSLSSAEDPGPMEIPSYWSIILDLPTGRADSLAQGPGNRLLPFASLTRHAAGAGKAWVGRPDRNEIAAYLADGTQVLSLVTPVPRRPVTREAMARHREYEFSYMQTGAAASREEIYRTYEPPDSMPAFAHLQTDTTGRLWVLRYQVPWSADDWVWDVYDDEGVRAATVRHPKETLGACRPGEPSCSTLIGSRVLEIGSDYMLIRHTDELGVLSVRRYPLERE